jgi:UDP:flavonoid glycosyltransferase YjiC (YdhE family)
MDQIVYFSFPAAGHVNPTLPVMQELTRRSEHVIYFSRERFAAAVRATGADYRPYRRSSLCRSAVRDRPRACPHRLAFLQVCYGNDFA